MNSPISTCLFDDNEELLWNIILIPIYYNNDTDIIQSNSKKRKFDEI